MAFIPYRKPKEKENNTNSKNKTMKYDDLFIVLLGDVAIPVRDPGCRQVQGGVDTEAADSGL